MRPQKGLLNSLQIQTRLNISRATFERLVAAGKFPKHDTTAATSRLRLWSPQAVADYLAGRYGTPLVAEARLATDAERAFARQLYERLRSGDLVSVSRKGPAMFVERCAPYHGGAAVVALDDECGAAVFIISSPDEQLVLKGGTLRPLPAQVDISTLVLDADKLDEFFSYCKEGDE